MLTMTVIPLNIRSREVRTDIADTQRLHTRIMSMFAGVHRSENRVLYRIEGAEDAPVVVVQAESMPNITVFPADYCRAPIRMRDDLADAYAQIVNGQHLNFRLRANVTKKLATQQQTNGKRIAITHRDDQVTWLLRKAQQCGFTVFADPFAVDHYAVTVIDEGKLYGTKHRTGVVKKLAHAAVRFEGRLVVVDADAFRRALHYGIGSAKAYGFGLLSVSLA